MVAAEEHAHCVLSVGGTSEVNILQQYNEQTVVLLNWNSEFNYLLGEIFIDTYSVSIEIVFYDLLKHSHQGNGSFFRNRWVSLNNMEFFDQKKRFWSQNKTISSRFKISQRALKSGIPLEK